MPKDASDGLLKQLDAAPLTPVHLLMLAVCTFGLAIDLADMALGGVLGAVFSTGPAKASTADLSLLLASAYVGGAVGAPLFGMLSDRHGRRVGLVSVMLVLGVSSGLSALSADMGWLTGWRLVSGFALGAYPPLMIALLTDILPARNRGALIVLVSAVGSLGAPATVFAVRAIADTPVLGLEGWRLALAVIGLLAVLISGAFARVPESPRWLLARGRTLAAGSSAGFLSPAPPSELMTEPDSEAIIEPARARGKWLLAVLFFLSPWATMAFPVITGAILIAKGFALPQTLLFVGVASFGPLFGPALSATVVDRVPRHWTMAIAVAGMAGAAAAFAASNSILVIFASTTLFGVFAATYIPTLSLYAAEVVPTASRARDTSRFWSLNRIGSALAPLLILPLLREHGPVMAITIMVASLGGSLAIMPLTPRGLTRRGVL